MARKGETEILPGKDSSGAALDGYLRLANAVMIQAVIDYVRGDDIDKLDVILWLASNEAELMTDILDLQVDVFKAVIDRDFKLPNNATCRAREKFGWRVEENTPRKVKLIRH